MRAPGRAAPLRPGPVPGGLGFAVGRAVRRTRGRAAVVGSVVMKIAMISEHASPLAAVGGVDAGGQNLHVAELAAALARQGHQVTVYTRRDAPHLAEHVRCSAGFDVVHVAAGPPAPIAKDELLPYMPGFGRWMRRRWAVGGRRPDVVHAHFWMSGVAAHQATAGLDVPVVLTFHALGSVKRRHQGPADTSPPERIA